CCGCARSVWCGRAFAGSACDPRAVLRIAQPWWGDRPYDRRLWITAGAARRRPLAADDTAAAPLVLYPEEHAPAGGRLGLCDRARRSSLEDRARLADRLPIAPHAGTRRWSPRRGESHRRAGQLVRCDARGPAQAFMWHDRRFLNSTATVPQASGRVIALSRVGYPTRGARHPARFAELSP